MIPDPLGGIWFHSSHRLVFGQLIGWFLSYIILTVIYIYIYIYVGRASPTQSPSGHQEVFLKIQNPYDNPVRGHRHKRQHCIPSSSHKKWSTWRWTPPKKKKITIPPKKKVKPILSHPKKSSPPQQKTNKQTGEILTALKDIRVNQPTNRTQGQWSLWPGFLFLGPVAWKEGGWGEVVGFVCQIWSELADICRIFCSKFGVSLLTFVSKLWEFCNMVCGFFWGFFRVNV